MRKKTKDEFRLEAKRIRTKYAYLDNLDELNGWMWEFLRRSKEYKDFNEKAETLKLIFENEHANDNDEYVSALGELFSRGANFFENQLPFNYGTQHPFHVSNHRNTSGLSELKEREDPDFICIHIFKKYKSMDVWETWMIPRYNMSYDRFITLSKEKLQLYQRKNVKVYDVYDKSMEVITILDPLPSPKIKGAEPFKLFYHNEWDLDGIYKKGYDAELNSHINNLSNKNLAITVIVSNKTNMRDIETKVVSQIKEFMRIHREADPKEKYRKRRDKWKYYLITYDLIEFKKLGPDNIANLFNVAFPLKTKIVYIADDIERYYSEGIKFIEKGKYKEYLFF